MLGKLYNKFIKTISKEDNTLAVVCKDCGRIYSKKELKYLGLKKCIACNFILNV